jgi:hypothetical protein
VPLGEVMKYAMSLAVIGFLASPAIINAAEPKPFGSVELVEATSIVVEKFQKAKGTEIAASTTSLSAQRTPKGATITINYEEGGKALSFSLPCHQHKEGDIDCH